MTPGGTKAVDASAVRAAWSRFTARALRPIDRPVGWGVAIGVVLVAAETATMLLLKRIDSQNAFEVVFLFGILVVAVGWNVRLAAATALLSTVPYVFFHDQNDGSIALAVLVFLALSFMIIVVADHARRRAAECEQRRRHATRLADQQTALRRVATLVATTTDVRRIHRAVVDEAAGLLGDESALIRFGPDGTPAVLAESARGRAAAVTAVQAVALGTDGLCARILASRSVIHLDTAAVAVRFPQWGAHTAVGVPVVVGDRLHAALVAGVARPQAAADDPEDVLLGLADLVATAVANADTRAELQRSRARVVAAADQARRGFERDLHDGAQQRIVALGMALREAEAVVPAGHHDLSARLGGLVEDLSAIHETLRELSHGIHPAVLSRGGLGPALRSLARASPLPVAHRIDIDGRLDQSVEVAAYYVIAEAMTNAAKHAAADSLEIAVRVVDDELLVAVADDGIGGAGIGAGSGLTGLTDRVEALAGRLTVHSPPGAGTTITVRIPLHAN
jgi:signal transduction histidine kinase